jgi:hypothetical protein
MRRSHGSRLAVVAAITVLGSGCLAPGPSPSHVPEPHPSPIGSPTIRPTPAATPAVPTLLPDASATPLPNPPENGRPLSAFTIICEDWPGSDLPADAIDCADAARLALAAVGGERSAAIRRLDIGFGDPCAPSAAGCADSAIVRWVTARSAAFETLRVRIGRDDAGELVAWPPVEGRSAPPPPFTAPPPAAPDLGADAPAEIRDRQALAWCGREDLTEPDAFDTAARRCFLGGVEGWVAVELVSISGSTEGGAAVTSVYRYLGQGGIERFVRSETGWAAAACALSAIDTTAAFLLVRPCEPIELHR